MSRAVMKQALDALLSVGEIAVSKGLHKPTAAIEALKHELAKPEPEPVAWMVKKIGWYAPLVQMNKPTVLSDGESMQPLYAAPTEPNCKFPTCHSQEYQRELVKEIIIDKDTASW